jgi:hypothetical protein
MRATNAATVQLSIPVIAALGGIVFLGESLTLRPVLASVAILVGISPVILKKPNAAGVQVAQPTALHGAGELDRQRRTSMGGMTTGIENSVGL